MMDKVAALANDTSSDAGLAALLASTSVEITARDPGAVDLLAGKIAPGSDVHVTFLPDDDFDQMVRACVRLWRAGFGPTPHLTARNIADGETFERLLARLAQEAGVTRALVIAGDVDRPRGPFSTSLELMRTGLLEKHGVRSVLLAGHPEGHPVVSNRVLDAALLEKLAFAQSHGLSAEIVTQFSFEAEPILAWLRHIRALGVQQAVRIGVAGPAGTGTLLKFAVRCGVGNSVRMLRRRAAMVGKLMSDMTPDELLSDVVEGLRTEDLGKIAGIHMYMFGGTRKTLDWLGAMRRHAAAGDSGS